MLSSSTPRIIYKALIESIINHAIFVWGMAAKNQSTYNCTEMDYKNYNGKSIKISDELNIMEMCSIKDKTIWHNLNCKKCTKQKILSIYIIVTIYKQEMNMKNMYYTKQMYYKRNMLHFLTIEELMKYQKGK